MNKYLELGMSRISQVMTVKSGVQHMKNSNTTTNSILTTRFLFCSERSCWTCWKGMFSIVDDLMVRRKNGTDRFSLVKLFLLFFSLSPPNAVVDDVSLLCFVLVSLELRLHLPLEPANVTENRVWL